MVIHDNIGNPLLTLEVNDGSYRYRAIRQGERVEEKGRTGKVKGSEHLGV